MPNPRLISIPFAESGTKNEIPVSGASEPQQATLMTGFPNTTQKPISEGGIPPERADFNGILNLYGQHIVNLNKGLAYEFDQEFADSIGGYPLNARIMLSDGQIAQNTLDGNTNNPNSITTGWIIGVPASIVKDASGKTQQELNNIYTSQLLTTEQFKIIIPEVDDTGRLQRAFDDSFAKQQTLYLVGNFSVSDTLYARHNFIGSSSTIIYPQNYNKRMLVLGAEKSVATTTRLTGKTVFFPTVTTSKTSGANDWTSNAGSYAITLVNTQECKLYFNETSQSEYGVYALAYNTDANYNQFYFGRHVFHKRPFTAHAQGDINISSMNQNTYIGGRFAVNLATERVSGIYLMHFLITGSNLSSINNNVVENPSVEGSGDEYAILFESQGSNISGMNFNTVVSPRLETGNGAGKKMAFRGDRVRFNRVTDGYNVSTATVLNENGAQANALLESTGATIAVSSSTTTATISCQNTTGVNAPTFSIFSSSSTLQSLSDAITNSVMYADSTKLYSLSATVKRWSLQFNTGRQEWLSSAGVLVANLYSDSVGLKSDYALSLVKGIGLFGSTPPASKRSITGKKTPTTITEQNAVLDSIIAAMTAYGLASDDRTA